MNLLLRKIKRSPIWLTLAVIGPGIIAGSSDNDPSGIYGYSVAGAEFGYSMLWLLALVIIILIVVQEMCARMALVTGKGLADLIREQFGLKITLFAMTVLFVANLATTVSEFAGMSAALDLLTQSELHPFLIPLMTAGIWLVIMRGSYRGVEQILLAASFIYLCYVVTAIKAEPDWGQVAQGFIFPSVQANTHYIIIAIGLIGTTITPWGLFFVQSAVRDKGLRIADLRNMRIDMTAGALYLGLIGGCVLIACAATLHKNGIHLGLNADAASAAIALKPLVGDWASKLFAFGLLNAAILGAIVVPLSTAYAVTESLGWESGLGRRVKDAPLFAGVYGALLFISALIVIIASPTIMGFLILLPNIVGGILLPIILIYSLKLVNDKELMGEYVNTLWQNIAAWSLVVAIIIMSVILTVMSILG